jgi:hypothetical protein
VATTGSNVRKDLTEWQEKHATMVLTTVKVKFFASELGSHQVRKHFRARSLPRFSNADLAC